MGYSNRTTIARPVQNQIDHIAIVIDASGSMSHLTSAVIRVVDNQIAYLARRSKELDREVRVSVYTFDTTVECKIFDKDVLRLPSIAGLYRTGGLTALVDATLKSQEDLATTSTIYGDHAFLTFVVTDGDENRSRNSPATLRRVFETQPENYTVAILVPDHQSADTAARWGFPADNIRPWDATSEAGFEAAGSTINTATENFFSGRAVGQRGSRSIFSTGADAVNTATVKSALKPLAGDKYRLIPVMPEGVTKDSKVRVDKFIKDDCGMKFSLGSVYYQWNKREKVQPHKQLAVVEKKTDKVYVGTQDEVRAMIGLPDMTVSQKADPNPDFDIFVQSTAPNRNLVPFTKVLVML
jgi:hypothetical protein